MTPIQGHRKSRTLFDAEYTKANFRRYHILEIAQGQIVTVGTVLVKFPRDGAGLLHLALTQHGEALDQYATCSGYGYNKIEAALEGMEFQGLTFPTCNGGWEHFLKENGYTVIGM